MRPNTCFSQEECSSASNYFYSVLNKFIENFKKIEKDSLLDKLTKQELLEKLEKDNED